MKKEIVYMILIAILGSLVVRSCNTYGKRMSQIYDSAVYPVNSLVTFNNVKCIVKAIDEEGKYQLSCKGFATPLFSIKEEELSKGWESE